MKLKCQRCKHTWDYQGMKIDLAKHHGFAMFTSCPKCTTSVKVQSESTKRLLAICKKSKCETCKITAQCDAGDVLLRSRRT